MKKNIQTIKLFITGMTCINCGRLIERELTGTAGILKADIRYRQETGQIRYDADIITKKQIMKRIKELGYGVGKKNVSEESKGEQWNRILGSGIVILAVYMVMKHLGLSSMFNRFPQAEEGMEYGMLFVTGLLTSVHCIAMCGGINLTQTLAVNDHNGQDEKIQVFRASFLYNIGRVISYTIVGAAAGALGAVVSFGSGAKGVVQIAAGVFMVIMGLNMLNLFPGLRRLVPSVPRKLAVKINIRKQGRGPLVVGLLNGLMPCGPLQAMQLYALSTGSFIGGALSMFLFSMGTVPLMFGLGALSTMLSRKSAQKIMTAGAVLVVVLGVSMFGNGMSLAGIGVGPGGESTAAEQTEDQIQVVNTSLRNGYEAITVQAGIPVRWTITAEMGTINGCNNRFSIPEYGIEHTLEYGENVIEFIPGEAGTYLYSCWMGMIRSTITVTDGV